MKWFILASTLCIFLAGIVSVADEGSNLTDDAAAMELISEEHYTTIFVQEGEGGSFVKIDDSGNYTLTVTGAIPYTIYFSDRPARDAGMVEMESFLEGFNFDPNNPPNALVAIREGEEERDMIVVELTEPHYDNSTDTLTYRAKLIADYEFESEWPQDLLPRTDDEIPEEFGKVVLVIDDCPCMPDPGDCKSWWRNSCWGKIACNPCGGCC